MAKDESASLGEELRVGSGSRASRSWFVRPPGPGARHQPLPRAQVGCHAHPACHVAFTGRAAACTALTRNQARRTLTIEMQGGDARDALFDGSPTSVVL